ncbi:TIR-NBS-LRR resistance protein, partial [Trifolium medium]|nr:TIR-NBS-LRR resistance protein [Trifolium medium]
GKPKFAYFAGADKKYKETESSEKGGIEKTMFAKAKQSVEKALSLSITCTTTKPYLRVTGKLKIQQPKISNISAELPRSCEAKDSSDENELQEKRSMLYTGSPIIIIEAPKLIKTAASSVPWPNFTLVKRGKVGRIVSKESYDVWTVRFSNGIYIIDGKYFKPLDLAEYS